MAVRFVCESQKFTAGIVAVAAEIDLYRLGDEFVVEASRISRVKAFRSNGG